VYEVGVTGIPESLDIVREEADVPTNFFDGVGWGLPNRRARSSRDVWLILSRVLRLSCLNVFLSVKRDERRNSPIRARDSELDLHPASHVTGQVSCQPMEDVCVSGAQCTMAASEEEEVGYEGERMALRYSDVVASCNCPDRSCVRPRLRTSWSRTLNAYWKCCSNRTPWRYSQRGVVNSRAWFQSC
jgi:hypothetical protein